MTHDLQIIASNVLAEHWSLDTLPVLEAVGGGDIHLAYKAESESGERCFIKVNDAGAADILRSEYSSLQQLANWPQLRYPSMVRLLEAKGIALLMMPFYTLSALDQHSAGLAGKMLALQHDYTEKAFGWQEDNYIGATPQKNDWCSNWTEFYLSRRLQPQIEMLRLKGSFGQLILEVEGKLSVIERSLDLHHPRAALLHGDLWLGNMAAISDGLDEVLFYDPAPYYGDAEADLAMTELFGGFPSQFYDAYKAKRPLPNGYAKRRPIYNLYHALNHVNLFGSGYVALASRLLSAI